MALESDAKRHRRAPERSPNGAHVEWAIAREALQVIRGRTWCQCRIIRNQARPRAYQWGMCRLVHLQAKESGWLA